MRETVLRVVGNLVIFEAAAFGTPLVSLMLVAIDAEYWIRGVGFTVSGIATILYAIALRRSNFWTKMLVLYTVVYLGIGLWYFMTDDISTSIQPFPTQMPDEFVRNGLWFN